jgi:hypothetical protein
MGVRGIFSLLRKHLPSFSTRKEYTAGAADLSSKRDLIVVDGNAFVYWFVTFILGRESSCLTNYTFLSKKLDEWLRQCYRLQIAFIFIFDGPTQPAKWQTKIKRMRNQSQDIYTNQLHKLQRGDRGAAPSVASVPPLLGMQAVTRVLLHHQSTEGAGALQVRHAEGEADEEIVRVAVEQQAVAILSNDSDMLFFHTREAVDRYHVEAMDTAGSSNNRRVVPVTVPLIPFASFHFSEGGRRLVLDAMIQRHCLAKATGVRSEVVCIYIIYIYHRNLACLCHDS